MSALDLLLSFYGALSPSFQKNFYYDVSNTTVNNIFKIKLGNYEHRGTPDDAT